jgi:hypothetical protein
MQQQQEEQRYQGGGRQQGAMLQLQLRGWGASCMCVIVMRTMIAMRTQMMTWIFENDALQLLADLLCLMCADPRHQ